MTDQISKVLGVLGRGVRLLGGLPALCLGIVLGIVLFWGFSPAEVSSMPTEHAHAAEPAVRWTCSMHPEIDLPNPGQCPKCGMALIPRQAKPTEDAAGLREFTTTENAKALMEIQTAVVERAFPAAEVRMVGKVDYDETRLATITAWTTGRLDRLFVDYTGVAVRKGDHMVSIYSPELYSAQDELLQALQAVEKLRRSEVNIVQKTAQATVEAAREKLRLLGLAEEQVAKIEQQNKAEDHVTIYAPLSGIVIHKDAQEGMYVKTGSRIYTIADLSQVWVKLDAYESDLGWLRYGQKVEFTSVSYPGETFTGTIAFIDPILNPATRTVKVRVNVPNPQGKLKPEMYVNGVVHSRVASGGRVLDEALAGKWMCPMHPEVVKDGPGPCDICGMPLVKAESLGYVGALPTQQDKALVIPVSAALVTGTRAIVYVEKPDAPQPTYEGREIVLGVRAGDQYLVRRGLAEGERVVARGNFKIDSALQIQARPSMMTPEGGGAMVGHQHGGAAHSTGEPKPVTEAELSPMFRQQLEQILPAAERVSEALRGERLDAVRAAFVGLERAIQAVDMKLVDGHRHMVWMDLAMRLGNDAFEGKEARTMAEARRVGQSLASNLASLRTHFALGNPEAASPASYAAAAAEALRRQLDGVFTSYFAAADALAGDDFAKAAEGFRAISAAVAAVDMTLLNGEDHEAWMKHAAALNSVLSRLSQATDLQGLRELLSPLSDEVASLAKRFPPGQGRTYYLLHCPMAFGGRGAMWLQNDPKVLNPYFGASMLSCGEVRSTIGGQAASPVPAASAPAPAPAVPGATAPDHHHHD